MRKPTAESKADRFRRVAEARVNKIIDMIRLLGNCSQTNIYEYTDEQISYIFSTLREKLDAAENRFHMPAVQKEKRFSLNDCIDTYPGPKSSDFDDTSVNG